MEKKCRTCKFWNSFQDEKDGTCQRYPPTRTVDGESRFPLTFETEWCGEWKQVKAWWNQVLMSRQIPTQSPDSTDSASTVSDS